MGYNQPYPMVSNGIQNGLPLTANEQIVTGGVGRDKKTSAQALFSSDGEEDGPESKKHMRSSNIDDEPYRGHLQSNMAHGFNHSGTAHNDQEHTS